MPDHAPPATPAAAQAHAPGWRIVWRAGRGLTHVLLGFLICGLVFPWLGMRSRAPIVRWWARGFLAALGIEVEVEGAWPKGPGAFMLASNHITWLDIFVVHAVEPVRFVSKAEVRQWPVAGFLAHSAGTLFLDRTRKRDTFEIGGQMREVLDQGQGIGIFPEGTTSDGSVLLPFFSPLLQPAITTGAMVVPTGIRYRLDSGAPNTDLAFIGEQTFLESVKVTLQQPRTRVLLRFGTPLSAIGLHRRELTQRVELAISELLGVPVDRHWRAPGSVPGEGGLQSTPVHARSRQAQAAAQPGGTPTPGG